MVHLLKSMYVDKFFHVKGQNHTMSCRTTNDIRAKGSVKGKKLKDFNIPFLTFPQNLYSLLSVLTSPPEHFMYYKESWLYLQQV